MYATDEGAEPLVTSLDRSLYLNRRDLAGSLKSGFEKENGENNGRSSVAVVAYLTGTGICRKRGTDASLMA